MIEFRYLQTGLTGMAQAHRANTMAGHLGAAVVAGVFFCEDHPDLPPEVVAAVQGELDRVIAGGEAIWFDQKKAGVTIAELFAPLPGGDPDPAAAEGIAAELAMDIANLRQSGHDAIFAAIALRALRDHPQAAAPAIAAGLRKLIAGFRGGSQGRGYFGKAKGWLQGADVALPDDAGIRAYADEDAMVEAVIGELIDSGGVRRQGFGGIFHLINHAAALVELARMGYADLAREGRAAHHRHLRLLRALPDVEAELGPLGKAKHDPLTAAYWAEDKDSEQWSAHLTHRIKTLYGFHTLLPLIEGETTRQKALDAFRYLMA
ncbi:MAG: hypothetical protein R3F11_13965 [Verrucomicrobiales bacterium]